MDWLEVGKEGEAVQLEAPHFLPPQRNSGYSPG